MGSYLNPGKQGYQMAVNSEIFVDKTEMIRYLNTVVNTQQRFVSVSRPRRFGKSMAADMICAYYDREADSRELFENKKLALSGTVRVAGKERKWDAYMGRFDVVYIVMTKFFKKKKTVEEALSDMQKLVIRDFKKAYPEIDYYDDKNLIQTIEDVYSETDRQLVIIIDEWDAVFRIRQNDKEGQTEYLDFLRDLMKDNNHVALVYMTGILPIKKYGEHSALNMFDEYSIMQPMELAEYTGFTEEEVKELCDRYDMSYDEISNWYDGYLISNTIPINKRKQFRDGNFVEHRFSIYSPLSVVNAMRSGIIRNYWNKTESYEALAEYIRKDYDGLKESVAILMDGGRLSIDTSTYQNDMTTFTGRDDVLSLLVHLGYLGFDDASCEVFIPNREILDEFRTSTKGKEWTNTLKSFEISLNLLKATWECDADKVAELVEDAHDKAGNRTYNDEAALSYGIQLAYYAAQKYYTKILELDTGKGYADIAYLPAPKYSDKPALLIELKYGKNVGIAMNQVRRQRYLDRFEHYKGNILIIGINYDRDIPATSGTFKHHKCVIEKA